MNFDVQELTSRVSTAKVARTKDVLANSFMDDSQTVDVALATNMISVGLDITRLGLMTVLSIVFALILDFLFLPALLLLGKSDRKPQVAGQLELQASTT